jgi:hypothetical protein
MSKLPATPHVERLKRAAIYRKAAQLLERETEGSEFSCDRIGEAVGVWTFPRPQDLEHLRHFNKDLCGAYASLFRPKRSGHYWGRRWGDDAHNCRILALCFMAAITERP